MLEIGSLVGDKYKILNVIGRGGMSIVYIAINEKVNKTWAIKEVRNDGFMESLKKQEGLLIEINTLKKLHHPYLPSIVDIIEEKNSLLIVMDYIEGQSLQQLLQEQGAQKESDVIKWAKQICDVLIYLHLQQPPIIYRDMKPSNIMIKPDGNITVIDFGTVKNYENHIGETVGIGTIGYAAPEQYIGNTIGRTDERTDIYGLGMTLYHALTNIDPCKNIISNHSIRSINSNLSHGMDYIIQKCTKDQPKERYQSCVEVLYDLENYQKLEPIFIKKQKRKLYVFLIVAGLSVICFIFSFICKGMAYKKASESYDFLLEDALKESDYNKKIKLYQQCIQVPSKEGKKDAYLGLIQTFKENDSKFSIEEAQIIETLVKNNKKDLQKNSENYADICFEIGKLFWYYFDYGNGKDNQLTKAKSSIEWFCDVIKYAPKDYKNLNMAQVYADIGIFYRDITMQIIEANDQGKYDKLYHHLFDFMNRIAMNEHEPEIIRLEWIELTRSALQQYAEKFKMDHVSKVNIMKLYDLVNQTLSMIQPTTEKTNQMKQNIESLLKDTLIAIETGYQIDEGG